MQKKIGSDFFWISTFFVLLYSLISLINHFCFRTYALDLGVYTAALYDYSHFNYHDSTSFLDQPINLLGDHFDLYLPIISPLSYVFGSYTLLIVQIAGIVFGAYGIYKIFLKTCHRTALIATLFFYTFFGVFSSMAFDYHSNVLAACLFPWLYLAIKEKAFKQVLFWLFLILIGKENMSFIMFFFLLGTIFAFRKKLERKHFYILSSLSLFCMIYFVIITNVVMPYFSGGETRQFRYSLLGENYVNGMYNILSSPVEFFNYLFLNHTTNSTFDGIKVEFWIFLALSGGLVLIFNWPFLFMLIPILFQKLYHDQPEMWGINDHYSAELAPILCIGVFETINGKIKKERLKRVAELSCLIVSIGLSIRMMDNPNSIVRKDNVRIYKAEHYRQKINLDSYRKACKLIPSNSSLSAQSHLHPHFAWRDEIYQFPSIKNAQYIVLDTANNYYPISKKDYKIRLNNLLLSENFQIIFSENNMMVLKKK